MPIPYKGTKYPKQPLPKSKDSPKSDNDTLQQYIGSTPAFSTHKGITLTGGHGMHPYILLTEKVQGKMYGCCVSSQHFIKEDTNQLKSIFDNLEISLTINDGFINDCFVQPYFIQQHSSNTQLYEKKICPEKFKKLSAFLNLYFACDVTPLHCTADQSGKTNGLWEGLNFMIGLDNRKSFKPAIIYNYCKKTFYFEILTGWSKAHPPDEYRLEVIKKKEEMFYRWIETQENVQVSTKNSSGDSQKPNQN